MEKIFTVNLTVCSHRQIDGEYFVNFCGLPRKYDLYCLIYILWWLDMIIIETSSILMMRIRIEITHLLQEK